MTPNGYPVEIHRAVVESDLTVYVNSGISLGFSGGWKSVCVGLSTWRSIKTTHHPDGMSMSVRNNRMHRVLDEMGAHLETKLGRNIFKVEMILADAERVAHVWAGSVAATRPRALEIMAAANPPRGHRPTRSMS
ncbi:MAG: lactate racemase domain-containing protein [Dehalococcoidia bacterium]